MLKNFRVVHNQPAGNGSTITYRIRVNNVASTLVVTLASTASFGENLATTLQVAAGDLVDIRIEKGASIGASPRDVVATVEVA